MEPKAILPAYAEEVDSYANMRIINYGPDSMLYEIDGVDGSGTVELFHMFPGVFLQFHSFHCKSFHFPSSGGIGKGLKISFCTEGSVEVRMSDNLCLFMRPGNLSMDVRTAKDSFQFPCGHYHGVELFLHDSVRASIPAPWNEWRIDLEHIQNRFCGDGRSYVICADERFKTLFLSMLDAPPDCKLEYLKIKVIELLFLLQNSAMPEKCDTSSFMTMGQVEIAKQIMEVITQDLGRHHSIQELAAPFGISASSVKNYFQGVYGKNISTYLREARMSAAALALKDSKQPIAEIASSIGYENASKFSAAFKNFFGETPLEYRRQSRCGI